MAGMKGFYLGLGGVAIVGAGALWWASQNAAATVPLGPIPVDAVLSAKGFAGYVEGPSDAPVEVVEFADFQCPACRETWVLTVQDVKERLVKTGQVRYVFRDFPLDIHDKARVAHHAVACADEQGAVWAMHDKLFLQQNEWSRSTGTGEKLFRGYAGEVGLDTEAYDACMGSGRFRARIQASYDAALELGVTSTPTFVIGNQRYPGLTYDQIKGIVDSLTASQ